MNNFAMSRLLLQLQRHPLFISSSLRRFLSSSPSPPPPPTPPSFTQQNPFASQLLVSISKTTAADLLIQTTVEKKRLDEIDLHRTAVFALFGATYLGGFQYWLMVNKFCKL
jgi:hypothetical protein